jgi:tetratricopeptide (TPR) repeat protein
VRAAVPLAAACALAAWLQAVGPSHAGAQATGAATEPASSVQDLVDAAWAAFDGAAEPEELERRREALLAAGPDAEVALRGLVTLDDAPPRGRRERARLARDEADARGIAPALAGLGAADAAVRADLAAFLGERRLVRALAGERVDALAALARDDPDGDVRTAALESLSAIDDPRALARLDALIDELVGGERVRAARALADHAGARERLVLRMQAAFADPGASAGPPGPAGAPRSARPLSGEALARLLRAYGEALVHLPSGGGSAAERRPLVAGRTDAAPAVRTAATAALDLLIAGLARQGEAARADRLLVALRADGLGAREVAYRRANLALTSSADLTPAREASARLLAEVRGSDDVVDREWRVRGALLAAAAELASVAPPAEATADAAGALARARELLAEARATLDGLASERFELLSTSARPAHGNDEQSATYAHLDLVVDLWLAVATLAEGGSPDDAALLARLRAMHVRQLEAQAAAEAGGARTDLSGFQPLFDEPLGPWTLLFANRESVAWPPARALATQADLARALAGVSAFEMPGFDPATAVEALRDPLADPERRRLLMDVLQAQMDGVMGEHTEERDRAHPDEDKLERLLLSFRILQSDLRRVRLEGAEGVLRRARTPTNLAYDLALRWIEEGHPAEARALAERMKSDLFAVGAEGGAGVSEPMIAHLEAAAGSAYMDEDDAAAAERAFRQAAARLEAYEESLGARIGTEEGDPELQRSIAFALANARSQRADVLLSLAVNANVRQGDQEAALAFFEQAFDLKQNDFMRVLLACYRARSGRDEEARAVLREVAPAPALFYNLACTHALLGDLDVAVDYLERELGENQPSARARARQAAWAREDPDLAALRGHPRFERLVQDSLPEPRPSRF